MTITAIARVALFVRLLGFTVLPLMGFAPAVFAQPPDELKGDAILEHPAGQLAVKAAELLTAGKIEAVIALGPKAGRDEWRKSAAYRKKTLSSVADFKALLPTGVLIIEDGKRATLNIVRVEQRKTKPGTVESSSTTVAIPFVLENGAWKLGR